MERLRWVIRIVVAAAMIAVAVVLLLTSTTLEPPQRDGPPALVAHDGEPRVWLLTKQIERKQLVTGGGRHSTGSTVLETRYHFDLRSFDSRSAAPSWTRRLLTLRDKEGGHSARARILGQDGSIVWLFVADQPVAVAAADGTVRGGRAMLEEKNAALRRLLPSELKFYTFDKELVVTAADRRRHAVRSSDATARDYQAPSEEHLRRITFQSTQWNGGYRTSDFLTRQARLDGRWLGLYSDLEAADAGFGSKISDPTRVRDEGGAVRRTLRTARIGQTKTFTGGSHGRLFDVTALPGSATFLAGGFLVEAGKKTPLMLAEPSGMLVVHRTVDEQGRLAVTRLGAELRPAWSATLPFVELQNRWQFADRLVLFGSVAEKEELIAVLSLRDGSVRTWNITLEHAGSP